MAKRILLGAGAAYLIVVLGDFYFKHEMFLVPFMYVWSLAVFVGLPHLVRRRMGPAPMGWGPALALTAALCALSQAPYGVGLVEPWSIMDVVLFRPAQLLLLFMAPVTLRQERPLTGHLA